MQKLVNKTKLYLAVEKVVKEISVEIAKFNKAKYSDTYTAQDVAVSLNTIISTVAQNSKPEFSQLETVYNCSFQQFSNQLVNQANATVLHFNKMVKQEDLPRATTVHRAKETLSTFKSYVENLGERMENYLDNTLEATK